MHNVDLVILSLVDLANNIVFILSLFLISVFYIYFIELYSFIAYSKAYKETKQFFKELLEGGCSYKSNEFYTQLFYIVLPTVILYTLQWPTICFGVNSLFFDAEEFNVTLAVTSVTSIDCISKFEVVIDYDYLVKGNDVLSMKDATSIVKGIEKLSDIKHQQLLVLLKAEKSVGSDLILSDSFKIKVPKTQESILENFKKYTGFNRNLTIKALDNVKFNQAKCDLFVNRFSNLMQVIQPESKIENINLKQFKQMSLSTLNLNNIGSHFGFMSIMPTATNSDNIYEQRAFVSAFSTLQKQLPILDSMYIKVMLQSNYASVKLEPSSLESSKMNVVSLLSRFMLYQQNLASLSAQEGVASLLEYMPVQELTNLQDDLKEADLNHKKNNCL